MIKSMDYEKVLKYIILNQIKGLGCISQNGLLDICGDIDACFSLNEADIIEKDVLGKVGVKRIHLFVQERNDAKLRSDAESILKASIENGHYILSSEDLN